MQGGRSKKEKKGRKFWRFLPFFSWIFPVFFFFFFFYRQSGICWIFHIENVTKWTEKRLKIDIFVENHLKNDHFKEFYENLLCNLLKCGIMLSQDGGVY